MSGIGVALVGAGPWGLSLARALERASGAPLRWICELDTERRAQAARAHPDTRIGDRLDDVLADSGVSAVVVATDAARHHAVGRQVLLAGRHALIEKPLALSVADARELRTLAEERARVLTVGHLLLHHPAVARAREMVSAGTLGDGLAFESVRATPGPPRTPGSSWWALAPHDVSLALAVFGASPVAVRATATTGSDGEHDIAADATLAFADGRVARIQVARFAPNKRRRFSITGSRFRLGFDELEPGQPLSIREAAGAAAPIEGPIAAEHADPLLAQCRHFLSCVARGDPRGGNAEHAVDVVRALEAGARSMRRGGAAVEVVPADRREAARKVA
jgi:predicted dehydrogenase